MEERLRGVPDYLLRRASEEFVENVRRSLKKFIIMNKSKSRQEQQAAVVAMEGALDELEKEAHELVKDKLWMFLNNV